MSAATERLSAALADRYRLDRELGQGGMATVYLAHDLKHDRQVAIKILKPELAAVLGAERFVVEIKTTAALQHPHILPLFDSGEAGGFLYYVMPFIDGETLRGKLDRETQLGVEESVQIARDVASALHYAHQHGVIHRDIKPENILLHDGRPVVADFGIALAVSAAAGGRMTETGLSLGTPHYMSPEQATAEKEISARSDVYSLGSVLYEMLTGNPPHTGASAQQIIMKIVTEVAEPVTKLRKSVPPNVAAAVAKSVERLPADRFATAAEFAAALRDPSFHTLSGTMAGASKASVGISRRVTATLTGGAALLLLLAAWGWLRPVPEPVLHVSIPPLAGTAFLSSPGWPALSPDGEMVVFAATSDGTSRLYRRPVNGFRVEAIEGSEDATFPFFSPDGAWVGFFTGSRQLRKVPLAGGTATTLADIPFWSSDAAWRHNGTIVVMSDSRGLFVVPDHGGALVPLAESDTVVGNLRLMAPQELEDGRLLAMRTLGSGNARGERGLVLLASEEIGWQRVPGNASGRYVPPGYLVAVPGNEVVAWRFDLERGATSGSPVAVLPGARRTAEVPAVTVNARGDVAYFAYPEAPPKYLVMVDRAGTGTRLPVAPGEFRHPRLSPDGSRLAVNRDADVWILDLRNAAWSRITTSEDITEPQWSADGARVVHTVFDTAAQYNGPVWRNADGSGDAHRIRIGAGDDWTSDWSPDGRYLAVYGGRVGMNVSVVDIERPDSLIPVTRISATARNARFSPDGRWLAYQSNETGKMQIYVVSFPALGQKRAVSVDGGTEPAWRPQGGELYFRNGPSMMAVTIRTTPALEVGTPRELFRQPFLDDSFGDRSYDVMPDGAHFLMFEANPAAAPELRVIRNWAAELRTTVGKE
jgi:serine/threonine-protein kinase